jgi:hypothetical protein
MSETPHPGEIKEKRCAECSAKITGPPFVLWLDGSRISTGLCCSVHHSQKRAIKLLTEVVIRLRNRSGITD